MPTATQANAFRDQIVFPTLISLNLWSDAAGELLLGTAIKESSLIHRYQIGGGPARGLFQMEPATHDDIWSNYLIYHPGLSALVTALKTSPSADSITELTNNDRYAVAMARIHYRRVSSPIPTAGNIQQMANYWKQYYNTPLGLGTAAQYIAAWHNVFG